MILGYELTSQEMNGYTIREARRFDDEEGLTNGNHHERTAIIFSLRKNRYLNQGGKNLTVIANTCGGDDYAND